MLVGAGHTHLHVIERADELRAAGVGLTVIAPATFVYSGMATAVAAGARTLEEASIDVAALTARRGVRHLATRVTDIDPDTRVLTLDGEEDVAYTVASLNLGSVARTEGMEVGPAVATVKPYERLLTLRSWLEDRPAGGRARLSIVGGGPTGLELAGQLTHRFGDRIEVTVLERGPTPGAALPTGARRSILRQLRGRGVTIHTGVQVTAVHRDHVVVDGTSRAHDAAVIATGLAAPPLVAATGLGDARGVPVTPELLHPRHDTLYAVGDAAAFLAQPLPKLGVHGVRQGPVLARSLMARAAGRALPVYRPQRRALQILDLGGRSAVASRGRWWLSGPAMRRLKDGIDERWLARYRAT